MRKGEPLRFTAQVYMGRDSGGTWRLQVTDKASGTCVLTVDLDHEAFSHALSGRMGHDAPGVFYGGARVGMRHEHLVVRVPASWPGGTKATTKAYLDALADQAEAANPGWTARREDTWNSHRQQDGAYSITLDRYVDTAVPT